MAFKLGVLSSCLSFFFSVSREPADKWANDEVG